MKYFQTMNCEKFTIKEVLWRKLAAKENFKSQTKLEKTKKMMMTRRRMRKTKKCHLGIHQKCTKKQWVLEQVRVSLSVVVVHKDLTPWRNFENTAKFRMEIQTRIQKMMMIAMITVVMKKTMIAKIMKMANKMEESLQNKRNIQ